MYKNKFSLYRTFPRTKRLPCSDPGRKKRNCLTHFLAICLLLRAMLRLSFNNSEFCFQFLCLWTNVQKYSERLGFVFLCVCVCVCVCIYVCMYVYRQLLYVCMYVYNVCMYVCVYLLCISADFVICQCDVLSARKYHHHNHQETPCSTT